VVIIDIALGFKPLCGRDEYELLQRCTEMAPTGQYIELGAYFGASTAVIADTANKRGLPMISIDRNPRVEVIDNLKGAGIDPLPRIVKGQSHIVPDGVNSVAFLFIDTKHDARTLTGELDAWLPLLVPGGIVALHDYWSERFPEMVPTIDRRLGDHPAFEQVDLVRHMIAFRRRGGV